MGEPTVIADTGHPPDPVRIPTLPLAAVVV